VSVPLAPSRDFNLGCRTTRRALIHATHPHCCTASPSSRGNSTVLPPPPWSVPNRRISCTSDWDCRIPM